MGIHYGENFQWVVSKMYLLFLVLLKQNYMEFNVYSHIFLV